MTLADLDLHFDMVTQLTEARDRLQSMRSFLKAQSLDGMPRGSDASRKVEKLAILIQQQEPEVRRLERIVAKSEVEVRAFINTIPDIRAQHIFSLRFLCGFSWPEVAEACGGKNTPDAVKSVCYRYLKGGSEP